MILFCKKPAVKKAKKSLFLMKGSLVACNLAELGELLKDILAKKIYTKRRKHQGYD